MIYLSGIVTIKKKIGTPLIGRPLSTILPEYVLMSHRAHCFIIDVQPNSCVAVSVRVKNVDCIVPAIRRLAMMVEHSIKLVMRWLRGLLKIGCHNV